MPPKKTKPVTSEKSSAERAVKRSVGKVMKAEKRLLKPIIGTKLVDQYLASLNNPFGVAPPPVGFGSLMPLTQDKIWTRQGYNATATAVHWMFVLSPSATAMLRGYSVTNAADLFSTGAVVASDSANTSALQAVAQDGRVITLGMKVNVRFAMTSVPPVITAGLFSTSLDNLLTLSPNLLFLKPQMTMGTSPSDLQVNWRPTDNFEFEIRSEVINGNASNVYIPYAVMLISGVPSGSIIQVEAVGHIECNSGILVPVSGDSRRSLSDEVPNPSSVFSKIGSQLRDVVMPGEASLYDGLSRGARFAAQNSKQIGEALHGAYEVVQGLKGKG